MSEDPSKERAAEAGAGRFVCVVGPSGAGKDTLIDLARAALADDDRFVFIRRLITRPPGQGEDHEPITEAAFADGRTAGAFAVSWRAHGLGYAIGAAAIRQVEAGRIVVCNLSRAAIPDAIRLFATSVVSVTAPPGVLAERIARRGRETAAEALQRVRRKVETPSAACDLVIENIDAPEAGAAALTGYLRSLARR